MKRTIYLLFSFILIFQAFSCKKDPVSPIQDTPGRRDYEWSVDTVKSKMLSLVDIWGSSPNDVWIVGNNGNFEKRLMHYNGDTWYSRGRWGMDGDCIFGFGAKDVYLGGYEIWHYDGYKWTKQLEPRLDSLTGNGVLITDIRGNNSNDLWAVGFSTDYIETSYGVIFHKDSKGWKEKLVLDKQNINPYQIYQTGEGSKCLIFALKYTYHPFSDSMIVFEYDGNKSLNEIAAGPAGERTSQCRIYMIQGKLLVEINGIIYEYDKGQYRRFLSIQTLNKGSIMGGKSRSDMFIWQREGLAHYNGTDTQIIFKLKDDIWLTGGIVIFEKEIFFLGFDQKGDYYLVKGKLKD